MVESEFRLHQLPVITISNSASAFGTVTYALSLKYPHMKKFMSGEYGGQRNPFWWRCFSQII